MYQHSFITHPSTEGHLSQFHFFAIVSRATIKTDVQVLHGGRTSLHPPTKSEEGFLFPHTVASTCHFLMIASLTGVG